MTLEQLQERLKAITEKNHGEPFLLDDLEVAYYNELIMYLNNIRDSAKEIAQLIMSAKIKQPGTPKKYFTEYERWSYKIENAIIFSTEKYVQGVIKDFQYKQKGLQCEPYKHGFILVKPATP